MKETDVHFCCPSFESLLNVAGKRGIGMLVVEGREKPTPTFILQARALHRDDEEAFQPEVPVSTVMELVVRSCPYCGRDLHRTYRRSWRGLLSDPTLALPAP